MNVYLTNTTKKHNSTEIPTFAGSAISCMLKEGSSIIDPVLIFERANVGHTYNYVSIPDFGRYYFVNDIVYDGARIYYYCAVDVLASFKSTIGNSSAYVLRSAYTNNEYIIDQYYPITTHLTKYTEKLNFGTVGNPVYVPWKEYGSGAGSWLVGVVNQEGVTYYCFSYANYKAFLSYLLSDAFMNDIGVDLSINPQLRVAADPIQYITCCVWLPFEPTFTNAYVKVATVTTSIQAGNISAGTGGRTVHRVELSPMPHPQSNARGEYLNAPNFTECRLVFPPFGAFELNSLELQRFGKVECRVEVDCTTAIGKLILYGYDNAVDTIPYSTILSAEAQVGVPMPVTQIITPGVSPVQLGMQVAGALASAATGNVMGVIAGGASALDSYQMGKIPKSSVIGSRGSIAAIHGYAFLEYTWSLVADNDVADHGQPLCAVYQLSTLPGYQMILEPHIHTTGTATEDDQINAVLSGGYFYE